MCRAVELSLGSKPSSLLHVINPFFPSSLVHPPSTHCRWWGTVPLLSCGVHITICFPIPLRTAFHHGSLAKDQLILMKCLFSCQAPLPVKLQMLLPRPEWHLGHPRTQLHLPTMAQPSQRVHQLFNASATQSLYTATFTGGIRNIRNSSMPGYGRQPLG